MADLKKLAEEIVKLTLKEAKELSDILKDEYGIEPAAGGAVAIAPTGTADDAKDEPSAYKVILKEIGDEKIKVIKTIREITNLGLKEAKDKAVPDTIIKENATKEEAEATKKKMMDAGAAVEIEPM